MLDSDYNIKIIDFGESKWSINDKTDFIQEKGLERTDSYSDVLQANSQRVAYRESFVGTPNYMSPEVFLRQPQTFAVDLWALGCILFKILTGTLAFPGGEQQVVEKNILTRNINWPKEGIEKLIDPASMDLIDKLLQINPNDRLGINQNSLNKLK